MRDAPAAAAAAPAPFTLPPLLLIHGAWQGAWVWQPLIAELQALGVRARAIDLPGNGWGARATEPASLDRYVEAARAQLHAFGEPAVVVGHSGGGITASQLAEREPSAVAALVYLAGMMLPDGLSFAALVGELAREGGQAPAGIGPHLQWNADRSASTVPAAAARAIFLHDADERTADWAAERLRPQPESGRAMAPRITAERFGRVPRLYVEALEDRSLALSVQRKMQALLPGALRTSMACGHVPQLVQPGATARILCEGLHGLLS